MKGTKFCSVRIRNALSTAGTPPLLHRSRYSLSLSNATVDSPESKASSFDDLAQPDEPGTGPTTYAEFLDQVAWKYKFAEPQNWLGNTPFPMNPSFRPPPPISDAQRETMYKEYMSDPQANSVRVLSQRYNLSLKRVDAILRLKGLERAWRKGKQLQTGFLSGMELLLGATTHKAVHMNFRDARYDVQEADMLEQDENRDASRQRYQRLYWESVPEDGSEPIVPGSLEHAHQKALQYAKRADEFKAIPELMPRVPDTKYMKRPKEKLIRLEREGRPALEFIDVGARFMDVNERIRRIATAGRKSRRRRALTETKRLSWRNGGSSSSS
ncbi:hypothetical protein EST38_g8818 [Candolleomyces aberdarensis]|uniref:37S ribosomal protein S35, mitochondrial n=1 Tax=Candolleomyces aberdarensis TaxID=2316362 RepID=A0A4Q2DEF9_9AGAR|nr:hypothetical protein EST38_g8818 [Candolleomyces aberdarensis]